MICNIFIGEKPNNESNLISKFEIIDGQPFEQETVPFRIFISSFDLSPSYKDVNSFFCVKYFLKILFLDHEDKAYSKEHEIVLYRDKY